MLIDCLGVKDWRSLKALKDRCLEVDVVGILDVLGILEFACILEQDGQVVGVVARDVPQEKILMAVCLGLYFDSQQLRAVY